MKIYVSVGWRLDSIYMERRGGKLTPSPCHVFSKNTTDEGPKCDAELSNFVCKLSKQEEFSRMGIDSRAIRIPIRTVDEYKLAYNSFYLLGQLNVGREPYMADVVVEHMSSV